MNRMNRRRCDVLAPLIAAACAGAALAGPATSYELVIIEPWNTSYSLATSGVADINNLNQVTGCATPVSGLCSFLWTFETGKVPIDLAGPINDAGVIIAAGTLRWPDGTTQTLPSPWSDGADLNNANVIAGSSGAIGTCPKHANREALVWSEATGVVRLHVDLDIWAADQSWAINEHNEVVGVRSSTGECGDQEAFYLDFDSGEHIDIHDALLGGASGITRAMDINDHGVVVGEGPEGGTVRPFLWHRDDGFTFLPAAPGALLMDTHFDAINNHGEAVGGAIVGNGWRAIIWDETNGVRDLNELVELPPNFVVHRADAINDNGWIIGHGHYGTWSPNRAVVLIPVALPPAADLDLDGAVGPADLAMLLSSWGPCTGCAADLDGDGDVDPADLAILLGAWT